MTIKDKMVKLIDFIQIKVDPTIVELDTDTKIKILDSATTGPAETRGLIVTFDLSNSGRRINNRIYPPSGQQAGVDSWTKPFGKPILMNHDKKGDPIGRFVSVEYVPLDSQAIDHLGSFNSFLEVKKAFDSGDAETVYKTMHKFNLLTDSKWPGVGKLVAKARITDPDAIQKFLDGRFLTFSAGSHTNSYTCMACGSAWHAGDICGCRPGTVNEDGQLGVFMTGDFYGDEGSVVNDPANIYSQVRHLEFDDSVDVSSISANIWESNADSISMTDSTIIVAKTAKNNNQTPLKDNQMLKQLMDTNVQVVAKQLFDGKLDFNLVDALEGASQTERAWLTRIHDALHYEYDYRLRTYDENQPSKDDGRLPTDVFKLHAALHEISGTQDFRDALVNGPLDEFDAAGASSTEFVVARSQTDGTQIDNSDMLEVMTGIKDLLTSIKTHNAPPKELNDSQGEESTDAQDGDEGTENNDSQEPGAASEGDGVHSSEAQEDTQEEEEEETQEEEVNSDSDNEVSVPWGLLDMALNHALGEAVLSDEARKELADEAFCGSDRIFPIADQVHADAAIKIVDSAGLSSAQKELVLASISEKSKMFNTDSATEDTSSEQAQKLADMTQDYATALKQVENLSARLVNVLDAYAKIQKEDFSKVNDSDKLKCMTEWFDKQAQDSSDSGTSTPTPEPKGAAAPGKMKVEDVKAIDNPGGASSQGKKDPVKLSGFEQKIINKYQKMKAEDSEEKAAWYIQANARYFPKGFDFDKPLN